MIPIGTSTILRRAGDVHDDGDGTLIAGVLHGGGVEEVVLGEGCLAGAVATDDALQAVLVERGGQLVVVSLGWRITLPDDPIVIDRHVDVLEVSVDRNDVAAVLSHEDGDRLLVAWWTDDSTLARVEIGRSGAVLPASRATAPGRGDRPRALVRRLLKEAERAGYVPGPIPVDISRSE